VSRGSCVCAYVRSSQFKAACRKYQPATFRTLTGFARAVLPAEVWFKDNNLLKRRTGISECLQKSEQLHQYVIPLFRTWSMQFSLSFFFFLFSCERFLISQGKEADKKLVKQWQRNISTMISESNSSISNFDSSEKGSSRSRSSSRK
jgi:hypothetical protein